MAICGDGGFMMNSQELETAVRLGMGLVILVLLDGGCGMIKWKQQSMEFEDSASISAGGLFRQQGTGAPPDLPPLVAYLRRWV